MEIKIFTFLLMVTNMWNSCGAEIWSGTPHYTGSDRFLSVKGHGSNAKFRKNQLLTNCNF